MRALCAIALSANINDSKTRDNQYTKRLGGKSNKGLSEGT